MTFCCHAPRADSWVTTRAPVRVSCQPVTPMRAASTGNGTRSSLATSRCLVVLMVAVSQTARIGVKTLCTGSQWGEVLGQRLNDRPPYRFGQVVAHAVDDDIACAVDHASHVATVPWPHHRILRTVYDDGGCRDPAGIALQAAGAENRVELAQHALRVVAACRQFLDAAAQLINGWKEIRAVDDRDVADLVRQLLFGRCVFGGCAERQPDHLPPRHRREWLARASHDEAKRQGPGGG